MAGKKINKKALENLYASGEFSLSQERSDFLLPQIVDFVERDQWINISPEFQRRQVWDKKKKSKFIESLLMNIPIPQIFLYETDYNLYEVMDGQQRLTSIIEFYQNKFSLTGLEQWKELNTLKYSDFPEKLQRGLDRRRISASVLLTESAKTEETQQKLKQYVFERLNTGGVALNAQELRNCLFMGSYNDLINELAGNDLFNDMLRVPRYSENISKKGVVSEVLSENKSYKRMMDSALVLRFFSLRDPKNIKGSLKAILDNNMKGNRNLGQSKLDELSEIFITRLQLVSDIFGVDAFYDGNTFLERLYESLVISVDRLFNKKALLIEHKDKIVKLIDSHLKDGETREIIIGARNSAKSVKDRLDFVEKAIDNEIS